MIHIASILQLHHIDLDLQKTSQEEAIYHVAALLKEDQRVLDWNEFYVGLASKTACIATGQEFEIWIPHTRTNSVSSMVMSAGRSGTAVLNSQEKTHYIFVIGVPVAMAADYLRIIGALARTFKSLIAEPMLRAQSNPAEFLRLLAEWEIKL